MSPSDIYRIDRFVGKPLCRILTLMRRLAAPFRRRPPVEPPRKILFLKLTEQGATVLAWRAIQEAIARVGRQNVYFWVFQENRPILDILDAVPAENVICIRNRGLLPTMRDVLQTLWQVRGLGIDAVIDMELFARSSAALAYLTGARRRVGLHRFTAEAPHRGDLFTHRVQYNPYIHTAAALLLLVQSLDDDPSQRPLLKRPPPGGSFAPPQYMASESERAEAAKILADLGVSETATPKIILNPNASDLMPLRKWPEQNFIELGRLLLARYPRAALLLSGSKSEEPAAARMAQTIGRDRVYCMAGRTSMRSLLAVYGLCDLLVTNDSGPGHFSALTPIRSLVLFGPETPLLYGPLSPRAAVIHKGLACSPCVSAFNHRVSPCRDNVCMKSITPGEVFAKLCAMLEGVDR